MIIRLHPNDSAVCYGSLKRTDFADIKMIEKDPGNKLLQISDIVIGMSSIILAESFMLGLNIISYQPVRDKSRIYVYDERILDNLVCSRSALKKRILELLKRGKEKSARFSRKSGRYERIVMGTINGLFNGKGKE